MCFVGGWHGGYMWPGHPCHGGVEAAGRPRGRRSKQPTGESYDIPFLGTRVETFLLTVFSWNFHAYPNLMCLGLLTAGHSCRQKE